MKRPLEQLQRWLRQAEHQLEVTNGLFELGFWSDVCFNAEQTAQMALKAFLFGKGKRFVQIHSIRELALECVELDEKFNGVTEWGNIRDRYYIATRNPNVLAPPAVPFESFTEDDAQKACRYAADIVQLVKLRSNQ